MSSADVAGVRVPNRGGGAEARRQRDSAPPTPTAVNGSLMPFDVHPSVRYQSASVARRVSAVWLVPVALPTQFAGHKEAL